MTRNLDALDRVAAAMERVGVRYAFVGGATIELFLDALGRAQARATDDVDCIVDVADRSAFYALESRLRSAGFVHGVAPGDPVCRWRLDGLVVDIMPIDDAILGFTNPFYRAALDAAETVALPSGRAVPCLTIGYTIATKVVAFEDRGRGDPWTSKDLEDLVALFDSHADLAEVVAELPPGERERVSAWATQFTRGSRAEELVEAHVAGPGRSDRVTRVVERIRAVSRLERSQMP